MRPFSLHLFLPSGLGAHTSRGRADPVRRGIAPRRLNLGNGGLESNLGGDKWRWGIYVRIEKTSDHISPGTFSYSRELKIDSNRWCSPGVRMPMSLTSNVVTIWICCWLIFMVFQYYMFVLWLFTLMQVIIMMMYANVENVDITLFNNQWLRIHMNSKQAIAFARGVWTLASRARGKDNQGYHTIGMKNQSLPTI